MKSDFDTFQRGRSFIKFDSTGRWYNYFVEESTFLNPKKTLEAAGLREGQRIADFGSGSGFFTRAAARLVGPSASSGSSTGVVWAVDINPELLTRVKNLALAEGLSNVEVMRGDVERAGGSNLPDAHFDFVLCTNLLFGIEHKNALVGEVRRVLKNSGKALVVDWRASYGGLGPHQDMVVSQAAARDLFEAGKFSFVDPPAGGIPAGEYHWGMVIRKQ